MRRVFIGVTLALAATAALAGGVAKKDGLPGLPRDYAFPSAADSPGVVTFSHASHVDAQRPSCTTCHPKHFRILAPGTPVAGQRITHEQMEAGRQCGACHEGKAAHGLEECESCHR